MLQFGSRAWPRMKDGITNLGERYFNPIWEHIDRRLHGVEEKAGTFDAEVVKFRDQSLERVNQVLGPVLETVFSAGELGFLVATSTTEATLEVGTEVSLYVAEDDRPLFAPTPWIEVFKADGSGYAYAELISHTRETGEVRLTPASVNSLSGAHDDWVIAASASIWSKTGQDIATLLAAASQASADATQTAADRVQTGLDRAAAAQSAADAALFDPASYYTKAVSDGRYATAAQGTKADSALQAATLVTGNTNLSASGVYRITAATAATLTLPASPTAGDVIRIMDGETISDTVQHVVARNGNTIMGLAEDLTLDQPGIAFDIWWSGTDWRLF